MVLFTIDIVLFICGGAILLSKKSIVYGGRIATGYSIRIAGGFAAAAIIASYSVDIAPSWVFSLVASVALIAAYGLSPSREANPEESYWSLFSSPAQEKGAYRDALQGLKVLFLIGLGFAALMFLVVQGVKILK